ncbi:MAG: NnrU family protein [Desulfomonilaceae bacterium]|nr:NnrU family protein [Desulfomonilaceae bacterium]
MSHGLKLEAMCRNDAENPVKGFGRAIAIVNGPAHNSGTLQEKLEESRLLPVLFYVVTACAVVAALVETGFTARQLTGVELIGVIAVAVPGVFLFVVSVGSLLSYFLFIPSITRDGHLFARVHAVQIIHPLTTAFLLGLVALCIVTGSSSARLLSGIAACLYVLQTVLIVRRVRREHLMNGLEGPGTSKFFLLLHLILGTEIVTVAAGARPLAPWKLTSLPEDTWIVDVRTKPEFYWNRLQGAESFPWGKGIVEAARDKPKDRPVLVTCFSGHRSPTVAVMLRKLGFETVYNLNWGILYLVLLERGRRSEGPFSLSRPHRDPQRRGEDVRGISVGYILCQALILIIAPLEHSLRHVQVSTVQQIAAGGIGLIGIIAALMSLRSLGRNFRVFAAPRRSGTLVTTGIYSLVRHPMYTGLILIFLGYLLLFGSIASVPLWLTFSVLYVVKSEKEERILADRFPEYDEYRQRTWKFVPYIY